MDPLQPITVFWFRRDLRLHDNTGLYNALNTGRKVLTIFIFDDQILSKLNPDDKRVSFIFQAILQMNQLLLQHGAAIQIYSGSFEEVFERIISDFHVETVFANHDYEPYSWERDDKIAKLLKNKGVGFKTFKDQVIFEKDEVLKPNGEPYTIFTPYSRRWLEKLRTNKPFLPYPSEDYLFNFLKNGTEGPFSLREIGFIETAGVFRVPQINENLLINYDRTRDFPALDSTSKLSVHLRFGTVSVRQMVSKAMLLNQVWLNEFIWREFFMQIMWHFPNVLNQAFKAKYQFIKWINNENEFKKWTIGETGYPLVDAGMRELNATGFMHNRVRMVTASFLTKHLLVNWQWGEAYFAEKLLDFELASNNGNWQWAAGTGCDAAPYFRIFNPANQVIKFDPNRDYIKNWVPEYADINYPEPIVNHDFARMRCLGTYKKSLT